MADVNPTVYREYDIRGLADVDFTESFARDLGEALGTRLHELGESHIVVGRDCRLTSEKYTKSLISGLLSTGIHVVNVGVCPTPLVYFAIFQEELENGIVVTGSHNPGTFNGFKMTLQRASLYGKAIQDLKRRIEKKIVHQAQVKGSVTLFDVITPYTTFLTEHITLKKPLKVVVDGGNGTGGPVAPTIFRKIGCHVIELFCDMDGNFPNHHPDPTVPENLSALVTAVKDHKADVGIAFDGDADRIGVVDNQGNILWGDELMVIYARAVLQHNPGASIIGEVKCSSNLFSDIKKQGGRPIMWKTGHSLIKSKLKEEKALLAGEMSGHVFFADRYFGYDDAIYAACRLIEILSASNKPLHQHLENIPKTFSTPEIRLDCPDEKKFDIVNRAKAYFKSHYDTIDIDGVRIEFPDGWALIRASNTQPVLVLRFEATSQDRLGEIRSLIENKLKTL